MIFLILLCALYAIPIEGLDMKLYGSDSHYKLSQLSDKCCTSCVFPEMKFYTISCDKKQCSETCLTRKEFLKLKPFIPGLTQDKISDLPCETYNYHIYNTTKNKGICPLCTDFDIYDKDYSDTK